MPLPLGLMNFHIKLINDILIGWGCYFKPHIQAGLKKTTLAKNM